MAPGAAHRTRRAPLHCALFEHAPGAPPRPHTRLGDPLLRRPARRPSVHDRHVARAGPDRPARRAWTRAGMSHALSAELKEEPMEPSSTSRAETDTGDRQSRCLLCAQAGPTILYGHWI